MAYSLKSDIQKEISDEELIGLTNDFGAGPPKKLAFTSGGTYEIAIGDVIVGAISGAIARVDSVLVTSGTWAGGDAAGDLYLVNQSGTFQAENLNVGTNLNVATIAGDSVDTEFQIKDEIITAAIAKADAEIDSYCGQVAEVPFVTVPAVIKQTSITLAIYYLFSRRSVAPEIRKDNYNNAIRLLRDIATGKASLPPVSEADVTDQVASSHTSEDRKITMGKASDGSTGTLDNY